MERTHTHAHPFSFTADSSLGSRPRREQRSSRQGQISQAQSARAYLIAAQAFLRPTPSLSLYKTALTGSEKKASAAGTTTKNKKTTHEKSDHRTAPSCDGRSKGTRRKALCERSLSPPKKKTNHGRRLASPRGSGASAGRIRAGGWCFIGNAAVLPPRLGAMAETRTTEGGHGHGRSG